jgi:hypothetical protein
VRKPPPQYARVDPPPAELSAEDLYRDGVLTVKEAAAFSGRRLRAMTELIRQKKVATKKDGKLRLVSRRSLVLYLAALPEN